ncbi:MAG: hypothetical protein KKC68_04000, partial [Candidatus Thermoplasmatota archaeon]|nr:hypothetical protein [Candidatus Thermoplasmatota archaeon]
SSLMETKKEANAGIQTSNEAFRQDDSLDNWRAAHQAQGRLAQVNADLARAKGRERDIPTYLKVVKDHENMILLGRPVSPEEYKYYIRELEELPVRCSQEADNLPNDQYHGSKLWCFDEVLESRNLSPTVDRTGGGSGSHDSAGHVSVTNNHTLRVTMQKTFVGATSKSGMGRYLPPGVVFVLQRTPDDAENTSDQIENPQLDTQMKAILTTPENVDYVTERLQTHGYPDTPVIPFHEWPKKIADKPPETFKQE